MSLGIRGTLQMKLKLKKFRKLVKRDEVNGALLCPWSIIDPKTKTIKEKGIAHWRKVGDVVDLPDEAGYGILQTHSDMLAIEGAGTTKRASAPANK